MDWKSLGVFATLLAVFVTMWWQLDRKIEYEISTLDSEISALDSKLERKISALDSKNWSAKLALWIVRLTAPSAPD
jgi:hypothetical protein